MFDIVTQENFIDYVKRHENIIAYFQAKWCGACRIQSSTLEKIMQTFPNKIKVAQIDVDNNPNIALAYQVLATPTLIFFKNGNKVRFKSKKEGRIDRLVGAQDFNYLQGIIRYLINMKIVENQ